MQTITLTINDIPDKVFIPVVRKRDILKAQIITAVEKANLPKGSSDVRTETPLGHEGLLSRNEIMNNYYYLSGHKISLSGWQTGSKYTLSRNDNTPAFAMMIPLNCVVELNGAINKAKNETGQYLVCLSDANGEIDRASASIISKPMFRKMFNVTPHEVISRHKGSGNKILGKNVGNTAVESTDTGKMVPRQLLEAVAHGAGDLRQAHEIAIHTSNQKNNQGVGKEKVQVYRFSAVAKLLNEDNKIVGFVIQDNKGMTKQISKREMLNLCSQKLVDNIILATREPEGSKYLRGNGIKIESLASLHI